MTIAGFAIADAPISQAGDLIKAPKAPPKRRAQAVPDRELVPEPR